MIRIKLILQEPGEGGHPVENVLWWVFLVGDEIPAPTHHPGEQAPAARDTQMTIKKNVRELEV